MPVTFVLNVNFLTLGTTVTIENQKNMNTIQDPGPTRRIKLGTSCAQNRPF